MPSAQDIVMRTPTQEMFATRHLDGAAMQKLQLSRATALESARLAGLVQPATIINFNPLPLSVESGIIWQKVPANDEQVLPPNGEGKRQVIKWKERTYGGSAVVLRDPSGTPRLISATAEGGDFNEPMCDYQWILIPPIALAWEFNRTYNDESTGNNMGGVVIYEGDLSVIDRYKKSPTPENGAIRVPAFRRMPDGTGQFYCEPGTLQEEISKALTKQRMHCERQLAVAKSFWDEEDQRKNITSVHRIWARYARMMGWIQNEPPYLNEQFETEESCNGCGAARKNRRAHFCTCGRPYDPFTAFMAGENVAEVYLAALQGEQLEKVKAEMKRRRDLFKDVK